MVIGRRKIGPFAIAPQNTHGISGSDSSFTCRIENPAALLFWIRSDGLTVADSVNGLYPQFAGEYYLQLGSDNRYIQTTSQIANVLRISVKLPQASIAGSLVRGVGLNFLIWCEERNLLVEIIN